MDLLVWIGSLLAAVGIAMSILACRSFAVRRSFLRGALTVSGRVVGMIERSDGTELHYFPRVRFETPEGREITFESSMGTGGPARRIGEDVRVCFRPEQPLRAELATFAALWGTTLMFGMLGLAFLFAGLGSLLGMIPA